MAISGTRRGRGGRPARRDLTPSVRGFATTAILPATANGLAQFPALSLSPRACSGDVVSFARVFLTYRFDRNCSIRNRTKQGADPSQSRIAGRAGTTIVHVTDGPVGQRHRTNDHCRRASTEMTCATRICCRNPRQCVRPASCCPTVLPTSSWPSRALRKDTGVCAASSGMTLGVFDVADSVCTIATPRISPSKMLGRWRRRRWSLLGPRILHVIDQRSDAQRAPPLT